MNKQNNKEIELKKHVSTIHCTNELTLLQRKIANALLYHAYDDLLTRDEHHISIRELCMLIGYDSHDYKTIKRALVDLLSTVIEWNIIEEGLPATDGEWNASSIIADASIKGGICSYSYSKRMKKLLYMPVMYGRLNMRIQAQFKSNYALALYENVIRYQNIAHTPWFKMPVFRKLMGVAPDKYAVFRDFKRRVLDKAVSEVNAIAQIRISPEIKREKRMVVAVRFLIQRDQAAAEKSSGALLLRLNQDFGLTAKQALRITELYEADYILEKMQVIETSSSYRSGKIVNLAKYLLSALEHDYQQPKSSKPASIEQRDNAAQQDQEQTAQEIMQEKQRKAYQLYQTQQFEADLKRLSADEFRRMEEDFLAHIQQSNIDILMHLYKKEGLKNKMLAMEFRNFVKKHYADSLSKMLSFEEYCANQI